MHWAGRSAAHFFDILQAEKATAFGTSAKYLASVEKAGLVPRHSHQLPNLKVFSFFLPILHIFITHTFQ